MVVVTMPMLQDIYTYVVGTHGELNPVLIDPALQEIRRLRYRDRSQCRAFYGKFYEGTCFPDIDGILTYHHAYIWVRHGMGRWKAFTKSLAHEKWPPVPRALYWQWEDRKHEWITKYLEIEIDLNAEPPFIYLILERDDLPVRNYIKQVQFMSHPFVRELIMEGVRPLIVKD